MFLQMYMYKKNIIANVHVFVFVNMCMYMYM